MSKVCLCMIVKDEEHVIRRCLESVKPLIDCWVVVDTGSKDNTHSVVRECLEGIPGYNVDRPWKNFSHNRNESIALAKEYFPDADYLYFIDADEELCLKDPMDKNLVKDAYEVTYHYGDLIYQRISMVSTLKPWAYLGVLHEHLVTPGPYSTETLQDCYIKVRPEGSRSKDPEKFKKDAAILEEALKTDPQNTRNRFYLAQSYRDAGMPELAVKHYIERATLGGWEEEVWYSLYQSAKLMDQVDPQDWRVLDMYTRAYNLRPERAEVIGSLARWHRNRGQNHSAKLIAQEGIRLEPRAGYLFVEKSYYDWICLDEYALSAYWTSDFESSKAANQQLLGSGLTPTSQLARITKNLRFCETALKERKPA